MALMAMMEHPLKNQERDMMRKIILGMVKRDMSTGPT